MEGDKLLQSTHPLVCDLKCHAGNKLIEMGPPSPIYHLVKLVKN